MSKEDMKYLMKVSIGRSTNPGLVTELVAKKGKRMQPIYSNEIYKNKSASCFP